MIKDTKSCESDFMSWLSAKVSPAQLSELYWCYAEIESACANARIISGPLFETTDTETIHSVQRFLEQNTMFRAQHLRQFTRLVSAGRYYLTYLTEKTPQKVKSTTRQEVQTTPQALEQAPPVKCASPSAAELSVQNTTPPAESTELSEKMPEPEIFSVDFEKPGDYTYTKPYFFSYFEESKEPCSSWTELYVTFFATLEEDYPHQFHSGMSFSLGGGRIELTTRAEKAQMFAPKPVPGTNYILETNVSSGGIVQKMKYILDLCAVDYENVVIQYTRKAAAKEDTSAAIVQPETDQRQPSTADRSSFYSDPLNVQKVASDESILPNIGTESSVEAIEPTVSEIEALLSEDIFLPLKHALAKENIRTMEELKALKLWAFMNQNNLYSISMRQNVLAKARQLLEPETAENPESLYELHCGSAVYSGDTPAKTFLHFCEDTSKKHPLIFRSLLDKSIDSTSDVKIYRSPGNGNFFRMENPTCYISADLAKASVIAAVEWMIQRCTSKKIPVSIKEPDEITACREQNSDNTQQTSPAERIATRPVPAQRCGAADSKQIEKAEKIVLNADLNGVRYYGLSNTLMLNMADTKALVQQCKHIVEINYTLYHEDAFIDWDDGAKRMCRIMEKLMQKNNGYISAAQLYDYARVEMNMFLNDNDVNDERSVYEIAQHLFEKNSFKGNHYTFIGKSHISTPENAISSNFDVICKFAEDQGGVFREDDLAEYLTGIGIKTGNLRNQMRLNKEPEFFFYEPGTIISAKSMRIDGSWKESVGRALKNLLNDADDHIILRQIQPVWYESLPTLPGQRRWTPLLLQFVLHFYGKEFGAKTIMAMESQSMDTLHAMLVKTDSPIQNFGDAVIAHLIESETEQRSFEAEELRHLLVKTGMIQGNELIWNMPKALAKDERFAWDAKGENVTVRV